MPEDLERGLETEQAAERLLELLVQLRADLHPGRRMPPIRLDSSIEDDLGLDSLGRMELLRSVEEGFGVRLPEQLIVTAETPRDVLHALLTARPPAERAEVRVAFMREEEPSGAPTHAMTLTEVLAWHAERHPERVHVRLLQDDGVVELRYGELFAKAAEVASGLQARGLQPRQTVALMLPTSLEYFQAFFGALLAGLIPVPIYPPFRMAQIEDHLRRQAGILNNAQAALLVSVPEVRPLARLLRSAVESLEAVETVAAIARTGPHTLVRPQPQDTAFLQYTSGSTGNPKGVVLSHANLLANIRAMGRVAEVTSEDVFVSWLPLYHDMGLIGAWLGSLYYGMPLVLMSPLQFLARPERWLWAIHRYRGTLSAAPNFAYAICAGRLKESELAGLDLGSWRMAVNGAEPVSPDTLVRFAERFKAHGFKPEALAPVYGLAESSVGLAFPHPGRGAVIDRLQREPFMREGRALQAEPDDPHALRFVSCGQPLPGHQIRIVDLNGRELPEREVGRLEFTGPSCTSGYYRNPEATRSLFRDHWLDSGDLGYIAGGDVYVTGRVKDLVIRAGRNVYPYELEEAIGDLPGIRKGCVAVFGSKDPRTATERLVVVAETRETDSERLDSLRNQINELATERLGEPPDEIVLAPPHAVLKTSSGKIRRSATRELYEHGQLGNARMVWLQVARLWLTGLLPRLRRNRRQLGLKLYAAYAWMVFGLLSPIGWIMVVLLPNRRWRRALVRGFGRLMVWLLGIRLHVHGGERLAGCPPCVLVANHSSFLDALVLAATMPLAVTYVPKRDFSRKFFTRVFFDRLGAEYVERVDPRLAVEDARRLAEVVRHGDSLFVFPEGGFEREPGLRPFRLGAFMVAAETGVPVVPIAIQGTRSMLRAHSWFLRRGMVRLTIGELLVTKGGDRAEAGRLREAAYSAILRDSGEPALEGR